MDISPIRVKKSWKKVKFSKNGKPYIKFLGFQSGFNIWKVDGEYIRKNLCEDFVNYDCNTEINFIPENELWVEKDNIHREIPFYVKRLSTERRLLKSGVPYKKVLEIGLSAERAERAKAKGFKPLRISNHPKKLYKKLLFSKQNMKVWLVNGRIVRDLFYVDYAEGGHDLVYKFIPKGEIWIDDDILSPSERKFILIHELHERRQMIKKHLSYHKAHKLATKLEDFCRHNPNKAKDILDREIRLNSHTTI